MSGGHEAVVRAQVEAWVAAVDAADPEGVLRDRADDVVMFDVPPPQDGARGIEAYHATWPPFLDFQAGGAVFELVELDVTAGVDVAYAFALLRCGTPADLSERPDRRLRLTLGLRREQGRWLVAHEHHSFALEAGA